MDSVGLKLAVYLFVAATACLFWVIITDASLNLPVGPPGLPVIGNLFSVRKKFLYLQLTEWSRKYGDLYCFKIGRNPVIVVSSHEAVNDLFVKRGAKYSSRPKASSQAAIITQNARIVAQPYGDQWRKHRKLYHDLLGMQNSKIFLPYQEYESRRTLKNLLDDPDTFWQEMTRYSASVTFSMLLSCRFDKSDALIPKQINVRMTIMFKHIVPGAWLVDWLPALDYLPDSMAPWRAKAVSIREQIMPFFRLFYRVMKERVESGTAPDCFLARILQEEGTTFDEVEPPHIIATTMAAGTDTTATTLQWFFKASVMFPEVIDKAREEIDRVVGRQRLPDWQDRSKLPYIAALINETHRWATVAPLAFTHATSDADVYRGKNIPIGASVYGNAYAIHTSPESYPKPEEWIPERYLPRDDPRARHDMNRVGGHYAYGFGRRECPGKHVADASLYIVISRLLWAFDIVVDPKKPPVPGYSPGLLLSPARFGALVRPRDAAAEELISETADLDRPAKMEDSTVYDKLVAELL